MDHKIIYLIHILGVAPLFWHIGTKKGETSPQLFEVLKYLAFIIAAYHGFLLLKSTNQDNFNEINNYDDQSDDDSDIQKLYDDDL